MQIRGNVQMRNGFATYGVGMEAKFKQAVRETTLEIVEDAASNAPVDTGALQASIHAVTDDGSGYEAAAATAAALSKASRFGPADIFPKVSPTQPFEGIAAVCVLHGIYNEYGTIAMPARPFFTPAVERARVPFQDRLLEAMKK